MQKYAEMTKYKSARKCIGIMSYRQWLTQTGNGNSLKVKNDVSLCVKRSLDKKYLFLLDQSLCSFHRNKYKQAGAEQCQAQWSAS